jgi:integrase
VIKFVAFHKIKSELCLLENAEQKFSDYISSIAPRSSASTQNQAWNAIVFLYRDVLKHTLGDIPNAMRARRAGRIRPVPCDHAEALSVVGAVGGTAGLALRLIYGTAMRIKECLRLRLKDFDFDNNLILIYDGKGGKDAFIPLPLGLRAELLELVTRREAEHLADVLQGKGWVFLPDSLGKKYPKWHFKSDWQYAFASERFSRDPRTGNEGRHHLSPEGLQQAMASACRKLKIKRRFTPHSLRHAGARFAEKNGTPISEIQRWLRHKDVETTLRYLGIGEHRAATVKGPFG